MKIKGFKILALLAAAAFISPLSSAMEATTTASTDTRAQQADQTLFVADLGDHNSIACAMDLMPEAKTIFQAVSPKVSATSNLRKLVKKEVKPKVFSGKLSIKSARENAAAASVCLNLLKMENEHP